MNIFLFVSFFLFIVYLIFEIFTLKINRSAVPLRIAVTGTRGKTSIVRMLASILREEGRCVFAKTTGSEANFILPDGEEIRVKRGLVPSIIEQKKVIRLAAENCADTIVCEIMSIHPENHYVEAQKILKPNIVLITNIRIDHTEAMGTTREEIGRVLSLDIPQNAAVFIPEKEMINSISDLVESKNGNLFYINEKLPEYIKNSDLTIDEKFFRDDLSAIHTLCRYLNISQKSIINGLKKVKLDCGSWSIYKYCRDKKNIFIVNGFAANDPESTRNLLKKVALVIPSFHSRKLIGLLCLRKDRGDRTLQWINFLKNKMENSFDRLFITGGHYRAVKRRLKDSDMIRFNSAEKVMSHIFKDTEENSIIFGFGNIKDSGNQLIHYWKRTCENYGI